MSRSLAANCGSLDSLNWRMRCGCRPCARQMRCTELTLIAGGLGHGGGRPVRRLAGRVGRWSARPPGRMTSAPSGGMRDGRVLSRSSPSTPSVMKRSCQRQTHGLGLAGPAHDLGGAATVRRQQDDPRPPDVLLRAVPVRHDRLQTGTVGGADFDVDSLRMPQTRMHPPQRESAFGFFRQKLSTSEYTFTRCPNHRRV